MARKLGELEHKLFLKLREKALAGDLHSIKYLLQNLAPDRWQEKPAVDRPGIFDADPLPMRAASTPPPFKVKLRGA